MNGPSQESSTAESTSAAGMASGAAFFDLDGTLVVGQTTLLLVKFLRKAGVVSRRFLLGTALWFTGYKLGLVKMTERSRNQGARVFAGRSEAEVERLMARFTDEVLAPRFHASATAALAEHQARGDRVVVVSAALQPVVKAVCGRLEVAESAGTACEVRSGMYSGRVYGPSPHGEEKQKVAAEYMRRWSVDSAACWAYADHGSDLPLLRAVGHPVAVNPKPVLKEVALREGWPVLP